MALATNTYTNYDAIGVRESLEDVIYNVDPWETPFLSMAKKVTTTNTLHEWQTDVLDSASTTAQFAGHEFSAAAVTPTVREQNTIQHSNKQTIVSNQLEAVNKAGRSGELTYQRLLDARSLRINMESILLNNQARVTGDASTTAATLRGLPSWVATNDLFGTGGASGSTSAARTDGTQRNITETLLKDAFRLAWVAGGNPDYVMVGPVNKQNISGFSGGATKFDQTEDKKLYATVDVYVSDFGNHKIIPNRFQRERDCFVLDMKYWAVAFLPGRQFATINIAPTGDAKKSMIVSDYTLVARNEKSSAGVFDLNTAII